MNIRTDMKNNADIIELLLGKELLAVETLRLTPQKTVFTSH